MEALPPYVNTRLAYPQLHDSTMATYSSPLRSPGMAKLARVTRTSTRPPVPTVDSLTNQLSNRLRLYPVVTRTFGEERIRHARELGEDIAVISMIPMEGEPGFRCHRGIFCRLGNSRFAEPGALFGTMWLITRFRGVVRFIECRGDSGYWGNFGPLAMER